MVRAEVHKRGSRLLQYHHMGLISEVGRERKGEREGGRERRRDGEKGGRGGEGGRKRRGEKKRRKEGGREGGREEGGKEKGWRRERGTRRKITFQLLPPPRHQVDAVQEETALRREIDEEVEEVREEFMAGSAERQVAYQAELAEWKAYQKQRVRRRREIYLQN